MIRLQKSMELMKSESEHSSWLRRLRLGLCVVALFWFACHLPVLPAFCQHRTTERKKILQKILQYENPKIASTWRVEILLSATLRYRTLFCQRGYRWYTYLSLTFQSYVRYALLSDGWISSRCTQHDVESRYPQSQA